MSYHIKCSKCSKCPPLTDKMSACGSLSQCCQWLTPVRQTKLTEAHFKTRELVLASLASFVKTTAFSPNLIIQCIEVGWIGATHH